MHIVFQVYDFQVFDTDEIDTIFDHFRRGEGGIPKFLRIPVLFAASIPPLLRDHWLHIDYSNIDFRFYLCLQILSDRSF